MSSGVRQALSVVFLGSGLLVGAGCDDSASITGGAQNLTMTITPDPAGVGRYEEVSFILNKVNVLPADPATAALYGADQLLLVLEPLPVSLVTGQEVFLSNIALGAGTYTVKTFALTPLVLVDQNLSTPPATCIESIAVIDSGRAPGVPSEFIFTDPPSLTFTVRPGQTNLALKTDVPGLIAGYEASFTCNPSCPPSGSPCLTAFNESAYRAAILANMDLE